MASSKRMNCWIESMGTGRRLLGALAFLVLGEMSLAAAEIESITGPTMGTAYNIRWPTNEQVDAETIKTQVDERLRALNSLMSTYDPESELSRFNASTSTDWFSVAAETALVVDKALEISRLSGGAFDPTVARLVGLWSFGADPRSFSPPADDVIRAALESVGAEYVEVRRDPPALKKSRSGVQLDLSAIAKGYGVDAVSALLVELGIENSMVEIGGEVRTRGTKDGQPWKIGIERPMTIPDGISATLEMRDDSLATSGDYRNFFERDGVRYSHTINPRTGRPVTHSLASVSVIAEDCMTADALATTLMVLGPEAGLKFAEKHAIPAYLLMHAPQGGFQETASSSASGMFRPALTTPPATETAAPAGGGFWTTFLLAITVFGVALAGLAAGVIFSNRRLQGSCGGARGLKDEHGNSLCGMCSTPPEECDRRRQAIIENATKS